MKYTYKAYVATGEITETVIDLSKVVAIKRAGPRECSHRVSCTGLRETIELLDSPAFKPENAEDYNNGKAANFSLLVEAWKNEP